MSKLVPLALLVLMIPPLTSCSLWDEITGDDHDEGLPAGAFSYTGHDAQGNRVATGWLTFRAGQIGEVVGNWEFEAVAIRTGGHPVGNGLVRAAQGPIAIPEAVELRLEYGGPRAGGSVADEYWLLHGSTQPLGLAGKWERYISDRLLNQGTFQAD